MIIPNSQVNYGLLLGMKPLWKNIGMVILGAISLNGHVAVEPSGSVSRVCFIPLPTRPVNARLICRLSWFFIT